MPKTVVFLLGGCGNVSLCTLIGTSMIRKGKADMTGLVTEGFRAAGLMEIEDIDFIPVDIRASSLYERALEYQKRCGINLDVETVRNELRGYDSKLVAGVDISSSHKDIELKTLKSGWIDRVKSVSEGYDYAIAINLLPVEPDPVDEIDDYERFVDSFNKNRREGFNNGVFYAYAFLDNGIDFINFSSSLGSCTAPMDILSRSRNARHMGKDGKTGETAIKTMLAPFFSLRNLKVSEWQSNNYLGNEDGLNLQNPKVASSKLKGKSGSVRDLLGSSIEKSDVTINYIESLYDRKIAKNMIRFTGFLGQKMSLEFRWEGLDSMLAAPLVLDLIRLFALAKRRGEKGSLPQLQFFFKDPYQVKQVSYSEQYNFLKNWVTTC